MHLDKKEITINDCYRFPSRGTSMQRLLFVQIDVLLLSGMFLLEFPIKFMNYLYMETMGCVIFTYNMFCFFRRLMKKLNESDEYHELFTFHCCIALPTYIESSLIYHISKMMHHYGSFSSSKELKIMHDCTAIWLISVSFFQ